MIIDASALVAIINREPDCEALERSLIGARTPRIGAPTRVEAAMVLQARFGIQGRTVLARLLQEAGTSIVPFDDDHADVAIEAFHRFGRGRHPARLNMGDCFTYATAYLAGEPLLCTGDDFTRTDLRLVSWLPTSDVRPE